MPDTVGDVLLNRFASGTFGRPSDTGRRDQRLLAAWQRCGRQAAVRAGPNEEMAGVRAVGIRQVLREVCVCVATSGPGAIICSMGCTTPSSTTCGGLRSSGRPSARQWAVLPAGGGPCQPVQGRLQRVRADVHGAAAAAHLIDRAIRLALSEGCPTCIIVPSDVFDSSTRHWACVQSRCPSRPGLSEARVTPTTASSTGGRSLNAGQRVAMLVGQGARGCVEELTAGGRPTGRGGCESVGGQGRVADDLAVVTGRHRLAWHDGELAPDDGVRQLLTVGSNFPYSQFR